MDVLILGPLQVRLDGRQVAGGPPQLVAVLGLLALADGRPVPPGTLVDALWGEDPPPSAVNVIQTYVARLRRALGSDVVRTVPGGYLLAGAEVDAVGFEYAIRTAREAGDLRGALGFWRGPVLPECAGVPGIRTRAVRLDSAAVLLGAAAAMRAEIGATPSPAAIRSRDRCADALRSRLGAATFTEAWTTGRQLRPVRALQVTRRFLDQLGDGLSSSDLCGGPAAHRPPRSAG